MTPLKAALVQGISTHAPRTGSDACLFGLFAKRLIFQPTLPARGATAKHRAPKQRRLFQPTLPARGATFPLPLARARATHFNPRSPHGERHLFPPERNKEDAYFNPRSPHGERLTNVIGSAAAGAFQPTLPARGATRVWSKISQYTWISTHAPRTGSDVSTASD